MRQIVFRSVCLQPMKLPMKRYTNYSSFGSILTVLLLFFSSSLVAFGQFQWSSYNASGTLISANVASGGDLASGTSVTFTIPANTQMSFMTKSFTPFSIAGASTSKTVTFTVSASAGWTGVIQRMMGWGLYNSGERLGLAMMWDILVCGTATVHTSKPMTTLRVRPHCFPAPSWERGRPTAERSAMARLIRIKFSWT